MSINSKDMIRINEISPRDGLQNIKSFIPTEKKLLLIDMLIDSNIKNIEATAFVSPRWVPQMADAGTVCRAMEKYSSVSNSVLVPNAKGFSRALENGASEIVSFFSMSEIHNRNNVNKSVNESIDEMAEIAELASENNITARINIATAFGYLEDEIISPESVLSAAGKLESFGYKGITLCDTTGIAGPDQVYSLCKLLTDNLDKADTAVHFHQNRGIEFANAYAAYSAGIRVFESAAGGLGGCPFADDAGGNIATEILAEMFIKMGINCGFDMVKLNKAAEYAKELQLKYSTKQADACN